MKWWETTDWQSFTSQVVYRPNDSITRRVAADWLDDLGQPDASARAALIRDQIAGLKPLLPLRPTDYAGNGFSEPAYLKCAGLLVDRGWPLWVQFLPYRFTAANVRPVFQLAPVTTCSTVNMCAYDAHGNRYRFHAGPEDEDTGESEIDGTDLRRGPVRRMAERGLNAHAELYRGAGLIPAPIFRHLPARTGAGGQSQSVLDQRRDEYSTIYKAALTALKAAWRCGRAWAGLPDRINGHPVTPELYAVWTVVYDTLARQYNDTIVGATLPPVPDNATDPFRHLERAIQAAPFAEDGALLGV